MKIEAFHVKDGDCLLITSDSTTMLVDGGRGSAFKDNVMPRLAQLEQDQRDLDLHYISHIDDDHISGALELIESQIAWKAFDFQSQDPDFIGREPRLPRTPDIKAIWHNGFNELIDDDTGKVEGALNSATRTLGLSSGLGASQENLFELYENLTTGVRSTLEYNYRIDLCGFTDRLNNPSVRSDNLLVADSSTADLSLGDLSIQVLGPTTKMLRELRDYWNDWLDKNNLDVPELRRKAEQEAEDAGVSLEQATLNLLLKEASELGEGEDGISEPNLASLCLLVEHQGKSILLTGDAGSREILDGLAQRGLLDAGILHVDVLKVQHHGAAANVTKEFCEKVTATHYVFCGNGAHTNPEKISVDGLIEHHLALVGGTEAMHLWFTTHSSTPGITDKQSKFLKSLEDHLDQKWATDAARIVRHYPQDDGVSLKIEIDLELP